jgi:hypothetical protein
MIEKDTRKIIEKIFNEIDQAIIISHTPVPIEYSLFYRRYKEIKAKWLKWM